MSNTMYIVRSLDETISQRVESSGAVTSILKCALETGLVDGVVAIKSKNGDRFSGIPVLITKPEDLLETTGSLHCSIPNIARFVKEYLAGGFTQKLAVVGKPCDIRSIIELQKRKQIEIDNLYLIGLNCTGTIKPAIARRIFRDEFNVDSNDVVREDIDGDKLTIYLKNGKSKSLNLLKLEKKGLGRRDNCRRCEIKIPTFADIACGKWGTESEETPSTFIEICSEKGKILVERAIEKKYIKVEKPTRESILLRDETDKIWTDRATEQRAIDFNPIMEMSYSDRLAYWVKEFEKCIKCYGCRDACPICYCETCLLEANRDFLEAGVIPPSSLFPLTRLAHVGDSCVNCGQCQDACPMELPLTKLFTLLNSRLSEVFDYKSGVDLDQGPPLNTANVQELSIDDVFLDVSTLTKRIKK
ncbi:MAG: Coenzyme F420 hydrogenase/dehydrogenase, beta subunit C-terminal domain [Candidatus Thorarchaeota archaeon]|nr:Coenzyme F420 hydrogenase/dehydrogenase, beta subunit C-terminal domain [Candidatus Thorarchaeota archaeon]